MMKNKLNVTALLLLLATRGPMTERKLREQIHTWTTLGGFPYLWRLSLEGLIERKFDKIEVIWSITRKGELSLEREAKK